MGENKIDNPSPRAFLASADPELRSYLDQLGITVMDFPLLGDLFRERDFFVSADAVEKAGLSYDFFQAFAHLTKVGEDPAYSTAARLLNREMDHCASYHSTPYWYKTYAAKHGLSPQKEYLSWSQNRLDQSELDKRLDSQEVKALKTALRFLGFKHFSGFEHFEPSWCFLKFENLDLIRTRINELGAHACWLTPESIKIGIFGRANGELSHQISVKTPACGIPVEWVSTEAQEFECTYLPSMGLITRGLSYHPEHMPEKIRAAAASTVIIIRTDTGSGSGVVALQPNYLLTAKHVISDVVKTAGNKGGKKYARLRLEMGEKEMDVTAEVLDVPGNWKDPNPDLVILYIPNLPKNIKPLSFSALVKAGEYVLSPEMQKRLIAHMARHPGEYISGKEWEVQTETIDVYLIGKPRQKRPDDLLVTPGEINMAKIKDSERGLLRITAPALRGNSGGPAVDAEGKIIGIVVRLDTDNWLSNQDIDLEKRNIIGAKIYAVAEWGPAIKSVIQNHQKKTKKRP